MESHISSPRGLAVRRVSLASIHEDPANARLHGERNFDAIVASLQRFGQAEPLVVNSRSGRLVAGHGRLAAMRKLGWTEADIVEVDLAEIDATALGIALMGGHVRLDGQLLGHMAHVEPGERVVAVDAPWAVLVQPLEPEGVLLSGAWDVRTGRGNRHRGVTTAMCSEWPRAGMAALRIGVDMATVSRFGDASPGKTLAIEASFRTPHVPGHPG